ncbi:MAG: rod shape-determining protein, partial [Bacteroidaceae bacterium]|nr:rod shape-determining protein [Bacteroidaceae bacterium]MCF0185334.1 rod shape-determining protein [Bacteroidaceae bacterium]
MAANRDCTYPDQELLQVIPQEYKIGNVNQLEPVGVISDNIEGRYLNIIAHSALRGNIKKCLDLADIQVAEYFIAPIALADCVLSDAEKRSGCAVVDLGAETTTVAVYKNNILRHLAVLPLGGANITKDICTQQIEEEDAEELKLKYGCAYSEDDANDTNEDKSYPVTAETTINAKFLNDIVESRVEEIIANVWQQISESKCATELLSGVVLTGGGANLRNIELAFSKRTKFEKIKTAKFVLQSINAKNPDITSRDGSLNTTLALLIKGKDNCFGHSLEPTETLFDSTGEPFDIERIRQKEKEEEARQKEAERLREEEERIQKEKEAKKKPQGKSLGTKILDWIKAVASDEE